MFTTILDGGACFGDVLPVFNKYQEWSYTTTAELDIRAVVRSDSVLSQAHNFDSCQKKKSFDCSR